MTGMDLLDAMEHVDPKLIEAAENPPVKKKKVVPFVWTGAAAAACLAVIAGVSFIVVQSRSMGGNAAASADTAAEAPAYEEMGEMPEAAMDAMPEVGADADAGAMLAPEAAAEGAEREDAAMAENAAEISSEAQIIAQLNEELQERTADETAFQSIELVMKDGTPTLQVTITKEQADLYDSDETASDAFDKTLTELADQFEKSLQEYSFTDGLTGVVYIEGQTEPYRFFDPEQVWY